MKMYALVIALFVFSFVHAKKTIFCGKVINPQDRQLSISYRPTGITFEQKKVMTTIDEKGYYKFVFESDKPLEIAFRFGNEKAASFMFFTEPGDSLFMEYDPALIYQSAKFSGKGAATNQLLNELMLATNPKNNLLPRFYEQYIKLSPDSFIKVIDSLYAIESHILKKWEKKISKNGAAYLNSITRFTKSLLRLYYPTQHALNARKDVSDVVTEDYYSFLDQIQIPVNEIEAYVANPNFATFFSSWIAHQCTKSDISLVKNRDQLFVKKYQLAKKMLNSSLAEYVKGYIVNEAIIGAKDYAVIEPMINEFCKGSRLKTEIYVKLKSDFDIYSVLSKGKPAPEFTLVTNEGNSVSLSDYKGKVVYIDFWASWCAPCRKEMAVTPAIKKYFEGKDIVFLYISTDTDEVEWKKAIAKDKIMGVHVLSPGEFKSALAKSYLLKMIPRYVIVGKKGEIKNGNAPRPSDPGLISELEMALLF